MENALVHSVAVNQARIRMILGLDFDGFLEGLPQSGLFR